ncbi:MAG: signal peptide peptidase SppA [Halioglobus sp.]|nr:signal peptide peptidase SppA [Halioglobus sp.]
MNKPSLWRRILSLIWRTITRIRLAMSNIIFLLAILFIYFVYLGGTPEPLPEKAALLLNISGTVVDQRSPVNPLQALTGPPTPETHEVLLRDIIESIDYAANDPAINSLVMELDALVYVGISKSQEILPALESFRRTGKPIIAIGDYFTQDQYLLASFAETVIAHPLGGVVLEGYSSYRNYFRDALEMVSINMHIFRAGEHKNAVEPFVRNDMSESEKAVTSIWLDDLWSQYTDTVEHHRSLANGTVDDYVNNFGLRLRNERGNAARAALQAGLVDRLLDRSKGNDYLIELVGASNEDGLYEAVEFERYVGRKRPLTLGSMEGDRVAVITASGNILPGDQPAGTIGGDSLAKLIRHAVEEDHFKAIVLRVNSGGGSMFASEIIREQLLYARAKKKPLVVSMGAVAASGGYYIAADADEIWATPGTITGSIGVFAAFPTFEELLARVGIHTDGVGTTDLAGALRPDRPLSPELVSILNSGVEFAYRSFLDIVAEGRHMSVEEIDPLAEGRVWVASDALRVGLIDRMGTLEDAVASAASLAGLDDYELDYVELPLSPRDYILKQLAKRVGGLMGSGANASLAGLLKPMREVAHELAVLQDPGHLYMRCITCGLVR